MFRIVVCVSGGGTNLQALLDAAAQDALSGAKIVLVYSNNENAYALTRAERAGIPTAVRAPKSYEDRETFERLFTEDMLKAAPDLIVLAGFLVEIPAACVAAFRNRIINIHPSLIPSFCGKGCYGLRVHELALARGVRVSGATVHFVDEGTDTGPILLQKAVAVYPDDTPKLLQRRIMEEAEWKLLPEAVRLIAAGRVRTEDGKVRVTEEP